MTNSVPILGWDFFSGFVFKEDMTGYSAVYFYVFMFSLKQMNVLHFERDHFI